MRRITRDRGHVAIFVLGLIGLLSGLMCPPGSRLTGVVEAYGFAALPQAEGTIFAVTAGNNLISFNRATPGAIISSRPLTGLGSGESIQGLDFRPRTGQLYALGSTGRLYTIDTSTGAAATIGATPVGLNGAAFGFDFNPTVDRLRLVSDNEQNWRLHPETGAIAGTDVGLIYADGDQYAGANPQVVGSAYTNNFAGGSATTLFGIDSNLDALVRQGSPGGAPTSPNTGQLFTVGALGVNTSDAVGFDIAAPGDLAYASLTPSGATSSSLYSINLTTGAAVLIGAIGVNDVIRGIAVVTRVEVIYALTSTNRLLSFNSGLPNQIATARLVTGLGAGEALLGIDFRPATGQLYALSSAGRLYTINTSTGAATPAGPSPIPLNGTAFGFDFNPTVDRLRLVSETGQNLRLNPNNGAVAGTDLALAYAEGDRSVGVTPQVVGSAYTNNVASATSTTLFGIDATINALIRQGSPGGAPTSPNTGQLFTVGALGVDTSDAVGFDIAAQTEAAFASLTPAGSLLSRLYTINTATGAATLVGEIGSGETIRDIAIAPRVEVVFAATAGNNLISFNSLTPGTILSVSPISGLAAGETIVGLDFRPASGQLYALSSAGRLYTLSLPNGGAMPVSPAPVNPPLNGASFGFDFNPAVDRLRLVSDNEQNLRLHPITGAVAATDAALAYAAGDANVGVNPQVVASAYTDNTAGTPSTTLFGIDSNLDALVRQGSPGGAPTSPNTGQLFTVGALGVDTSDAVGFDISDCTGLAYASLNVTGAASTQFYSVNLATGTATLIGNIGTGELIRGLAVATTFFPAGQEAGLAVVNAASYANSPVAPDSIASAWGNFQTQGGRAFVADSRPLPTTLGGVRLTINGTDAGLFFVSNEQINFLVPPGTVDGPALVTVTNANGTTVNGTVQIVRSAPGIFTLNATGQGTASAVTTFDGATFTPVFNPDGSEREVDPGTRLRPNFLVLFGTGLRLAPAANANDANGVAEAVSATIQGVPATVTYAGPVAGFVGLDQINLAIPPQLAGQGRVRVRLTVNGQTSNAVTIRLGGAPPEVTMQTIAFGQTIAGELAPGDQVLAAGDGSGRTFFFDAYRFTAAAGSGIALDLRADLFDPAVLLYRRSADGSLAIVASDDQLGGLGDGQVVNNNALLLTVLRESGDYVALVTSAEGDPNGAGGYRLQLIGNAIRSISYGDQLTDAAIATSDLQTSAGDYLDAYSFAGIQGDRVQIRMSAPSFDPLLILNLNTGETLAGDDNSGGGQNALLTQTLPETGIYIVVATPFAPNQVGPYTLALTRASNAPAGAEASIEGAMSRPWRMVRVDWQSSSFERYAARRIVPRDEVR
jgi:uncharacterized protein (TIGR03437 family)